MLVGWRLVHVWPNCSWLRSARANRLCSSTSTGWFRFYFDDHRWVRSEQVQRPHGYEPGRVRPTTELVLSHKHPEDRGQVAATIDDITHNRGFLAAGIASSIPKVWCAGWSSSGTSSAMTTVW